MTIARLFMFSMNVATTMSDVNANADTDVGRARSNHAWALERRREGRGCQVGFSRQLRQDPVALSLDSSFVNLGCIDMGQTRPRPKPWLCECLALNLVYLHRFLRDEHDYGVLLSAFAFSSIFRRAARTISSLLRCRFACLSFLS